jgi:Uncharacterized protein conserved in bacteria
MGIRILKQPYVVEIGGKKFCLGHGDGLGPGFWMYKLMRWGFHNRVLQVLFSALHPRFAFFIGNGWSKRSRLARACEYSFRGKREPIYKFAVDFDAEEHIDFFIFGHFHASVDMELPSGARLMVLKDWVQAQSSNWIVFDSITGCTGISQNTEK